MTSACSRRPSAVFPRDQRCGKQHGVTEHPPARCAGARIDSSPGPFEIDDLYASGLHDDLEVTLREADGEVRTFFVPSQAAPLALRPGSKRFEFAAGVWRDELGKMGPGHLHGSWQQGLNNHLSVHGGAWLASDYLASAMGVAINSGVGAVGLTRYHSRVSLDRERQGHAWRMSWRHRLTAWETDLGATLTQYAGYYRFDDFAQASQGHVAPRGGGSDLPSTGRWARKVVV